MRQPFDAAGAPDADAAAQRRRDPRVPGDSPTPAVVKHVDAPIDLLPDEEEGIVRHSEPRLPVVYEIVRRRGATDLERPFRSLWWSGVAAGIGIGLSVLGQAILAYHLPEAEWAVLVEKLGYSVGFVVVILAGQQLFTENTLTVIAPLLAGPSWRRLWRVSRLWSIVLIANFVGAACFAAFGALTPALSAGVADEIADISRHALAPGFAEILWRGLAAGFVIASLVWTMARVPGDHLLLIVLFTWLIAVGDFSHIIAGSAEATFLVLRGEVGIVDASAGFLLPALLGNVIGGTGLFALLAYGQIAEEMDRPAERAAATTMVSKRHDPPEGPEGRGPKPCKGAADGAE